MRRPCGFAVEACTTPANSAALAAGSVIRTSSSRASRRGGDRPHRFTRRDGATRRANRTWSVSASSIDQPRTARYWDAVSAIRSGSG
ncbi:hypothetical protein [Amycolatopsis regifaucium]|uniref:Uncharacterized protein n=1 Tax=Amycolatopsis regifaucium TaxID=546365 RepID=A0A154M5L5_9PSEU|nr:hypothetical protein [Amycolatopsis regifaucium]KZB79169.1 hypothetical protein AVL48_16310 [Amycolatopsis regifaucium]OKA07353.1 hypothetical protein ATP06_0215990 [Amycolatopsis regifaucium]